MIYTSHFFFKATNKKNYNFFSNVTVTMKNTHQEKRVIIEEHKTQHIARNETGDYSNTFINQECKLLFLLEIKFYCVLFKLCFIVQKLTLS